MDENIKTEWKVGLFLLFGASAIMFSLFLLGADRAIFNKYIKLHVHFDQVQGLAQGSLVSLSGVVVGNVESITFIQGTRKLDLSFRIEEKFASQISKSATVDIRTAGALGDKFIFIEPGKVSDPPVEDGDILTLANTGDLLSVIGQRASEAEKVFDIINNLHVLTSELTQGKKVTKLLNSFQNIAKNAEGSIEQTQALIKSLNAAQIDKNIKSTFEKMDHILTKIDHGQGTLGALINDPSLHDQLTQVLGGSNRKKYFKDVLRTAIEGAPSK